MFPARSCLLSLPLTLGSSERLVWMENSSAILPRRLGAGAVGACVYQQKGLLGSLGRDVQYQGLFSPWGSLGDAEVAAVGARRTAPGLGAA